MLILLKKRNSDKFTNQFKYYNYTIEEWIYSTEAKVTFTSLETSPMIKEIVYLELVENLWKVAHPICASI